MQLRGYISHLGPGLTQIRGPTHLGPGRGESMAQPQGAAECGARQGGSHKNVDLEQIRGVDDAEGLDAR